MYIADNNIFKGMLYLHNVSHCFLAIVYPAYSTFSTFIDPTQLLVLYILPYPKFILNYIMSFHIYSTMSCVLCITYHPDVLIQLFAIKCYLILHHVILIFAYAFLFCLILFYSILLFPSLLLGISIVLA